MVMTLAATVTTPAKTTKAAAYKLSVTAVSLPQRQQADPSGDTRTVAA